MSTILMSIKPKYVEKIFNGTKKYEFRKRKCKENIDRIIVYSSSPVKKVVGELIISDTIYDLKEKVYYDTLEYAGISKKDYLEYFKNQEYACVYKIREYIIYDKEKDLIDYNVKSAPQSYIYINNMIK